MGHNNEHELGHVVEPIVFKKILIALLCLTIVTVIVAPSVGFKAFDFGSLNIVIALFIASVKATLVMLWFMHLKYENKVTIMYVIFPIVLLFCMLAGIFIDNPYRDAALAPIAIEKGKEITLKEPAAPVADDHHKEDHH